MSLFDREEDRELGPEMTAEGWLVIGGDHILWMHAPSRRAVAVDGPWPRKSKGYDCTAIPPLHAEPADPETRGYLVTCRRFDELGNPYEGDAFWVESYGEALKHGRKIRSSILTERPPIRPMEQMELPSASRGTRGEES